MRDRRVLAIVGSAVVAVAAVVVVVLTSLAPTPQFSSLADDPQTGVVAYGRSGAGEVVMVDLASGVSTTSALGRDSEILGWDENGDLVVASWGPGTERHMVVDASTGEVANESAGPPDDEIAQPVAGLWSEHRDGQVVILGAGSRVLVSFDAPRAYEITTAASFDDGRVVFVDSLGRVAVAEATEDVRPVLVAEDAEPWRQVAARPA
jgi:hypothetical protein